MIVATFNDFVQATAEYTDEKMPRNWRAGQGAFNLLCTVRPDLAERVRGSDFDPFYRDSRLPLFYEYLARNW